MFLHNAPVCMEGARDVGMTGVLVDPANKRPAFELTRQLLRIAPETRAWRLVRGAERAYQAQDLDTIMQLFHPEIVIYWNGERVASGHREARQFHIDRLGIGPPTRTGAISGFRRRFGPSRATRSASSGTRGTPPPTAKWRTAPGASSGR